MGVLANVSEDLSEETGRCRSRDQRLVPDNGGSILLPCIQPYELSVSAAISTMAQQMQSRKWFWFAIIFQNVFAYCVALMFYQFGLLC